MPDTSFLGLMQAHVGGLVRVAEIDSFLEELCALNGKVEILLRVISWAGGMGVIAEVFIDGKCHSLAFLPGEIEIIGGDDAS
jgi:hypothetical protein